MSSLVSEFIINPVLRQARRFSEASPPTPTPAPITEPSLAPTRDDNGRSNGGSDHALTEEERDDNDSISDPIEAVPASSHESSTPRPLTSSTQETVIGEQVAPPTSPAMASDLPRDHLGFPISPRRNHLIPEDDGMRELRSKIHGIQALELPPPEKARLMHDLLSENYYSSRTSSFVTKAGSPELGSSPPSSTIDPVVPSGPLESLKFWQAQLAEPSPVQPPPDSFVLTDNDKTPSFAPIRRPKTSGINTPIAETASVTLVEIQPRLGCQHYERSVKLQCFDCDKWYPCRLCHNSQEDHELPRFQTRHMLCMLCTTPQLVSDICVNCGELAAQYYCNICKLWENRSSKPIYHCPDCGICRRGLGLGKDYVHCKTCCACIPTSIETSHKCIERSTDCDCPICGEYMFSSPRPVVFMLCGHSIHKKCYDQHMKVSYKCPICNKSLANMETQFRNLDIGILDQPMPPEFRDTRAVILCNDCSARSTVPYHWLGLKCSICRSYNTVELQILGGRSQELQAILTEAPEAASRETPATMSQTASQTVTTLTQDTMAAAGRRRHSSIADGLQQQRRTSEMVTGSFPPLSTRLDSSLHPPSDTDSDDGMLGFWGRGDDEDGTDSQAGSEIEHSSDGEDEDEEDDNEILLIGHR